MDAIVKYSVLNPLATCFVPGKYKVSSCITKGWNDLKEQFAAEVLKDEVLNENVTTLQSCIKLSHLVTHDTKPLSTRDNTEYLAVISNSSSCIKSSVAFSDGEITILLMLFLITLLQFCTNDLTKDETEYHDVGIDGLTGADGYHEICIDLIEAKQHYNASIHGLAANEDQNVSVRTQDDSTIGKTSILGSETSDCNCPPMFGYIIPHDFFGNPFNLNPCCSKKCVHIGRFSDYSQKRKRCNTYPTANVTIPLNLDYYKELEKYTEEFGEVISDVCRIVSESIDDDYVNVSKQTNKEVEMSSRTIGSGLPRTRSNSTADSLEMEETNSLLEYSDLIEGTNMQYMSVISKLNLQIECPAVDSEDEGISLMDHRQGNIRSSKYHSLNCESQMTCYPPCSVWCDSHILVPNYQSKRLPAHEELTSRMLNEKLKQSVQKPLCKRSLSTNDALKRENVDLKSSIFPDYERLTNINLPCYAIKKCQDKNTTDCFQMEKGSVVPVEANKETAWGPFDGMDSLWQPLPDCISSNESMLKQNGHKRIRELKRQRSLN